jgi:hypothetical protein
MLAIASVAQPDSGAVRLGPGANQTSGTRESGPSKHFCRSKRLVGAEVKDPQGQKIGDISELYLNPCNNGQTLAAIHIGRRHAIVPLQALSVTRSPGAFRDAEVALSKSKTDVEAGPVINGGEWQKLDDPSFMQTVYAYYGIQPPVAVGDANSPGGVSTGSSTNLASKL